MLTIKVPEVEFFDEDTSSFVQLEEVILELEHSLAALSKWESIWEKPFLTLDEKTNEEILSYIECMSATPISPKEVFPRLSQNDFVAINDYMQKKMTATWFREENTRRNTNAILTNEVIYHWMDEASISWEAQYWHLARLFTLIRVTGEKRSNKKMSHTEAMRRQHDTNLKRRAEAASQG